MSRKVAIGIGCRKDCATETIVALVRDALSRLPGMAVTGLFTIVDKYGEEGLVAAAGRLDLPLQFLPRDALRVQRSAVLTRSDAAERQFGVPSVAEAAALAGAGPGATLILARISNGGATCAAAALGVAP
jgi:cobalt-precorrin 5A hydrolase